MPTRLYFPSSGAAPVTPAAWQFAATIAIPNTYAGARTPSGTAFNTETGATGVTSPIHRGMVRYVYGPLQGQSISGSVKAQMRCAENNAGANATLAMAIKLIQPDGSNRSTLLAQNASDATTTPPEMATSLTNRRLLNVSEATPLALTTQTATAGDYLVVEIGFRSATTTSRNITLRLGDNSGSDLAENDTATTDDNPWIEFSGTLTFAPPTLSSAAATQLTHEGAVPTVSTDKAYGTAYMVIVPDGDSPSVAQIKAGQRSNGSAAIVAESKAVSATGTITFSETVALSPATAYDIWFVHAGIAEDSSAVKADVTTYPLPVGPNGSPILDDFNRADENPISGNWLGFWGWTGVEQACGLRVIGKQAAQPSGSPADANTTGIWATQTGANCEVFQTKRASTSGALVLRVNDPFAVSGVIGGYGARVVSAAGGVDVYRMDADTSWTLIDNWAIPSWNDGDCFALTAIGSTIAGHHRPAGSSTWTQIDSLTDTTYPGAGHIGWFTLFSGTPRLDNFGGGTLASIPEGNGVAALALDATGTGQATHYGSGTATLSLGTQGEGEAPTAAVAEGFGTAALSLNAEGVGLAVHSGTGAVALVLDTAGVGHAAHYGTGSPALTLDATGVGVATHYGDGAAALALSVEGVGTATHYGDGTAALALSAEGVGDAPDAVSEGSGVAALSLSAEGTGAAVHSGTGTAALSLNTEGVGVHSAYGTGNVALSLDAEATGAHVASGEGSVALSLGITAQGEAVHAGTGELALALAAEGVGVAIHAGEGTAALSLSAEGEGEAPLEGVSDGFGIAALSLDAEGVGAHTATGTGTASLTLDTVGVGAHAANGSGTAALLLGVGAVGVHVAYGDGSATLALDVEGEGDAPVEGQKSGDGVAFLSLDATGEGQAISVGWGSTLLPLSGAGVGASDRYGFGVPLLSLDAVGQGFSGLDLPPVPAAFSTAVLAERTATTIVSDRFASSVIAERRRTLVRPGAPMGSVDDTFVMDPDADLPFERDFTSWLAGESLSTVTWAISNPALLTKHDEATAGPVARVWLAGQGTEGVVKVRCTFTTTTGRRDDRTWSIELKHR